MGELDEAVVPRTLAPSDAQRLSWLRVLLGDARRRAGDESEFGLHLAVVGIDGIGELAIGLCVQHVGAGVKERDPVPVRLSALIETLGVAPPDRKRVRGANTGVGIVVARRDLFGEHQGHETCFRALYPSPGMPPDSAVMTNQGMSDLHLQVAE